MENGHNNFKEHLPVDCPPREAEDKPLENVYRLCINNPPKASDFLSHVELNKTFPPEKTCMAAGLSIYTELSDAEKSKKRIPAYRKKGYIACGNIIKGVGRVLSTPTQGNSHHTWWTYRGTDASIYFK